MIKIHNLSKVFTNDKEQLIAVQDVNINIKKGEIFGIIGLSGAGKSTLIRCLNRLEEPTEGKIFINGIDLINLDKEVLRKERKEIGMIFQHFNLLSQKTVYENIAFPLRLEKMDNEKIHNRVNELLEYVDLKDKKDNYPSQLSGGQKQRVAIAKTLCQRPKIILADEPVASLDISSSQTIMNYFKTINEKKNITILINLHDVNLAKRYCNRIIALKKGKILFDGRAGDLDDKILKGIYD